MAAFHPFSKIHKSALHF